MTGDGPSKPDERLDPLRDPSLVPRLAAAKRLGLSPEALDRATKRGDIKALRGPVTRRVYYCREEISDYERRITDGSVHRPRGRGVYSPTGDGRPKALKPIRQRARRGTSGVPGKPTGRWIARYRDADGKVRRVGIFGRKAEAEKKTAERIAAEPRRKHRAIRLDELCAFAIELDPLWVAKVLILRFTAVGPGELPVIDLRRLDRNAQMLYVAETFSGIAPPAPRKGTKTHRPTPTNPNPGRWVPFPSALADSLLELQPEPIDGYHGTAVRFTRRDVDDSVERHRQPRGPNSEAGP